MGLASPTASPRGEARVSRQAHFLRILGSGQYLNIESVEPSSIEWGELPQTRITITIKGTLSGDFQIGVFGNPSPRLSYTETPEPVTATLEWTDLSFVAGKDWLVFSLGAVSPQFQFDSIYTIHVPIFYKETQGSIIR